MGKTAAAVTPTATKQAPVKEVWRGDIASGNAGGHSTGEKLLGNAATPEEIAATVKAHPTYAGPILGAAAKRFGNAVATKAAELSETVDHSAHVMDRDAMASSCDIGDEAKDQTAQDPGTKLPFDEKGGWNGLAIADKLGQFDRIGGTDNDAQRCSFANLLTTKILAGASSTKSYLDSVYKRVGGGAIEIKEGRADAMGAAANALAAISGAIAAKTATFGDLSWAQEALYEVFIDEVGSGTMSRAITNFVGQDQGYFTVGKELSGSTLPHNPGTNQGCVLDATELKDWAGTLMDGEAYVCAWIGPMANVAAVSHQIMVVNHGGKPFLYDPEIHGDGKHMIPLGDARVKKYFAGGNRIAMTFKMNAPPKETKADATDAKKKGATAAK